MKLLTLFSVTIVCFLFFGCNTREASLTSDQVKLSWKNTPDGWVMEQVQVANGADWLAVGNPSGEYTLLYSATLPDTLATETFKTITGVDFPEPAYKYQKETWRETVYPVPMNTAGEAIHFFPSEMKTGADNHFLFSQKTDAGEITADWSIDPEYPTDVLVTQTLVAAKPGYFSMSSPAIATVEKEDMAWVTVPGYFQGNTFQPNFVLAHAYGHGIPERPTIYRERASSTLSPIISTKEGASFAAMPEPGYAFDPWASDHYTHGKWQVGVSHMSRKAALTPTVYYPILGQGGSLLATGDTLTFKFRYSLHHADWYETLKHVINGVYRFKEGLALRKNRQSLTSRVAAMHHYLTDPKTSMWNIESFQGLKIGGQSYLGGVVGSDKDAMKNSDYGAMWMMAKATDDPLLKNNVLPYALNFKLVQQQSEPGFFQGAAIGQYYLAKSKRFVEEWGAVVEPIALTYYTLLDMGNMLLFEPENKLLQTRLRLGADLLLKWQKPDGSWEVAYDKNTEQPAFEDIRDLRPTFYGMVVAYRILKDEKYLSAARKGADWLVKASVEKGSYLGVCGDARYAPDFATAQTAQALLDLYDLTQDARYRDAAISAAKVYTASVYTHPIPSRDIKQVNGIEREDWELAMSGLSFEHGGIFGSANRQGPILLASHAGMFIRMYQLTGDSLFADMARAAAIGRDLFVDSATSVASYYWRAMGKGAGPYPHHAWWQIGWITDYLMAEAEMRSGGEVVFPRGFITPKVGPHQTYGFAPGKIYGTLADLIMRDGLVLNPNPNIEVITALGEDKEHLFVVLLNDLGIEQKALLEIDPGQLGIDPGMRVKQINDLSKGEKTVSAEVTLSSYGVKVLEVVLEKR